ncbi:MAG: hypothetical protein IT371_25545 [Deltaproteobacteria bacterium]|nr:hypothetical protein [Deltaproteobacteria bacterium]
MSRAFCAEARRGLRGLALLACLAWFAGCPGAPCDPGQVLENSVCRIVPPDAGKPDARRDGGARGDGAGDAAAKGVFGAACAKPEECGKPLDFCAIKPGEAKGFCTQTGCDKDKSLCPKDWTCFDLSALQAGLPWICVKF